MAGLDLDLVRHALAVARQRGYDEVELGVDGWEFAARLEPAPKAPVPALQKAAVPLEDAGLKPIKAAHVGYYTAIKPGLKKGSKVQVGDIVGEINALGIASDVEALFAGEVKEILVKDGDPVEYGQPLFVLKV